MAGTMIVIDPEMRIARGALPRRALLSFARDVKSSLALQGEVSILLTGDAQIRELNRLYRKKDKATDVLSFPAGKFEENAFPPRLGGDIAVSLDAAQRQAQEHGHSLFDEVRILLLHGMLHLQGFDHETDSGQMARKERALRTTYALPQGLIQRTQGRLPSGEPRKQTPRRVAGR